jgi:O-antigen ligase
MVDSTLEDYVMTYSPTRTELWQAAMRVWRRHPLLGVGPDNFRHVYSEALAPGRRLAPGAEIDERIHANSLYFETLADLGVLGVLALVLVMVALARAARRGLAAQAEPLAAAQVVALGTFFVHGLLDWFLEFTPTYALCSLLTALVAVSGAARAMKRGTVPPA